MKRFKNFIKDEDGQGMVEYAIIIGAIAVAGIAILLAIKPKVTKKFNDLNSQID